MPKDKSLLGDLASSVERVTEDPGANNGEGKIGRSPYAAGLLPETPMPNPAVLASKIQQLLSGEIAMYASSYIGTKVGDLLSPPSIGDIQAKMSSYLGKYIENPAEIMKELMSPMELLDISSLQSDLNELIGGLQALIAEQVAEMMKEVNKYVDEAVEAINSVTAYIVKGPAWVEAQLDIINNKAKSSIDGFVGTYYNKLNKEKQKFIDAQAEKLAKKMAAKMNEKIFKVTFEIIKKPQQILAKAKAKAMSAVKGALLNLKATIGL